jgi:hypothetical protein
LCNKLKGERLPTGMICSSRPQQNRQFNPGKEKGHERL